MKVHILRGLQVDLGYRSARVWTDIGCGIVSERFMVDLALIFALSNFRDI